MYKIFTKLFKIHFLALTVGFSLQAQDVSFTQFFAVPYQINPALTGAIDGSYRVGMIYKDQWRSALDNPFTTTAVGGEVKFDVKKKESTSADRVGISLFFMNDRVNTFALNTSQISLSGAFHKMLDKKRNQFLGIGAQLSIVQRNINYDQLNFGDEFNNLDGFDQSTFETLPPNNLGYADLNIGLNYSIRPTKKNALQIGLAMHHLTTPNASFFNNIENLNPAIDPISIVERRTVLHVSYDQVMSEYFTLLPRVLFQQQGNDQEFRLGANMRYYLEGFYNALFFGAWVSGINNVDGFSMNYVSPLVGIQIKSFIVGLSYDINIRDLTGGTRNFNAFELSIRFNGDYYNDDGFCPEF